MGRQPRLMDTPSCATDSLVLAECSEERSGTMPIDELFGKN
jgi:hypothetical protein